MTINYRARLRDLKKKFDACDDYSSALLLSSAPAIIRTRDEYHEYRQNSNFFYLTGSLAPDLNLLLLKNSKTPILIERKLSAKEILWEGGAPNLKPLAQALGAELIVTENPRKEILSRLMGHSHLYFDNTPGSVTWAIAQELMALASHNRGKLPLHFSHCDGVLENLRLFKTKDEINFIKRANAITNEALLYIAPRIEPGLTEEHAARTIEYVFRMSDAQAAFGTIVGTGRSAATLHHRNLTRTLRSGEMVLIDCGAEFQLYCGDITRVMPVNRKFTPEQKHLYDIVLESQLAALRSIKHGVRIGKAYDAAAKVMTQGLVELKVLRGKVSSLLQKHAYQPYFPHGIGHSVGIDVHDVGRIRNNKDAILEEGMVITVEPGLYFPKAVGRVPACGVRIEDNVLVTKRGCEILSAGFPKKTSEIEAVMEG
jgi:Xaa-Pro aminopeptidase